ncbi:MAG TPA: TIGR03435 family protein [Verrucomicrobiae bacterium]
MSKSKIILASIVVVVVAAAVAVKWLFFPSVKDSYFALNNHTLEKVPAGLVVVRPSHFSPASRSGITGTTIQVAGKPAWRVVGRNVTLKEMMALAYGKNQGRVLLPVSAPTNHFDFLVTMRTDQQGHLRNAIRRKLGYVGQVENHENEVLALKVKNGTLPGLTVSAPNTKDNVNFNGGRLYFTHMQLHGIIGGMEEIANLPVVDKTDLTNFYDFSVAWGQQTQRALGNKNTARATLEKIIGEWGLGLETDTETVEMLVVKSAS